MFRQGDIFIAKLDTDPLIDESHPIKSGILVRGEATGHSHRLEDPLTAQIFTFGADLLLRVTAPLARIIHDEHGPIELPKGTYRVWRQREYSPEAIRVVRD